MILNGAQIHLLVNHIPTVGFIGTTIALAVSLKLKSTDIKKFVLIVTLVVGLSALAPYFTGEPAESIIENLPGISKHLIHEHEEIAEIATILSVITGIAAGVVFYIQRRRPEIINKCIAIILALSLITTIFMSIAAHKGGKIRHPEISSSSTRFIGAQS